MWNKIKNIASWVLGVAGTFVLFAAAISTSKDARLASIEVRIDYSGENYFLTEDDVLNKVQDMGYTTANTFLDTINPSRIEAELESHPFIEDAEVYKELNAALNVEVTMRKPILRIFNTRDESLYLDEHGVFMPLSSSYSARTPVASGNIQLNLEKFEGVNIHKLHELSDDPQIELIYELFILAKSIQKDQFWKAQFNQYYINRDQEIEVIPRVGDHIILMGNAEDLEKKLNKLMMFYREGLNKTGWNEYKTINLKYANQVVCTKS